MFPKPCQYQADGAAAAPGRLIAGQFTTAWRQTLPRCRQFGALAKPPPPAEKPGARKLNCLRICGLGPMAEERQDFLICGPPSVAILLHLKQFSGTILPRSLVGGDMTSPGASGETQKSGGGYKLLGWIALPLGVIMILVVLFSHRGLYQIYRFRHERLQLEQENARLAAENTRLARTIDRLQHDPVLIQDLIRQELNFVKPNEIIFQFPPEKPAAVPMQSALDHPAAPATPPGQALAAGNVEKSSGVSRSAHGPGKKQAGPRRQ
jgi:cell division protein FtsB